MSESTSIKQKSLYERFQAFITKNREENLKNPTGWHDRLQNIYVSHHRIKDVETGSANQWQKYSDKK